MKRIKLLLMAALCMMISASAFADDRPIAPEQLPAAAKAFVKTYFAGKKIIYAEKDFSEYECRLDDGTEIKFNRKGNWDKVDCQMAAVPAVIVPEAIKKYVQANFPGQLITKIDKERWGIEIELSNDLDLKFDYQGNLYGFDD